MQNPDFGLSKEKIDKNEKILSNCRTFASILGGCVTGVLGLTGLLGFVLYFVCSILLSLGLLVKSKFSTKRYFRTSSSIWTSGVGSGLMTYILFWTLMYDIVYIFF
eukprot:TRINITY_DN1825_c0_g1_i1.p2 TRINITY_DN1825_c0_g1~~TRINITY_DN1825_c0_g1_i1.p2  ORF type:complete len:106 (-),score=6.16 TRINITY_DN1825_c0_g1_i1:172-489(-)